MTRTDFFPLEGGLNLVTPPLRIPTGNAIASQNYEPVDRGYQRVHGFEAYDGPQARPSEATYYRVTFKNATSDPYDTGAVTSMVGDASSSFAVMLSAMVVESGSFGAGDAAGYFYITAYEGEFIDGEDLVDFDTMATFCQVDGVPVERAGVTDAEDVVLLRQSVDLLMSLKQKVPGSGPIRGIHVFKGRVFAFRDSEDGTEGAMWEAITGGSILGGWFKLDLASHLKYKTGSVEFQNFEIITGGTSGATATIERFSLESGSWPDSDAAGKLAVINVVGAFVDGETLTGSLGGAAVADGALVANTLAPGGRYQCHNYNFYGSSNLERMYCAYGEGQGFEHDGVSFLPITTGMADDRPTRCAPHRKHLFFAFRGGSLQHSSIGEPMQWSVVTGAGELGIGSEITDLLPSVSGALAIWGEDTVNVLLGTSAASWELRPLSDTSGGEAWTAQMIGSPVYLDNRGLRSLDTTDRYGDFQIGTISRMVEPIFKRKKNDGVLAVASIRVREKDQYRIFFNDGTGVTAYFGRQNPECMPFNLGIDVRCATSGKDSDGREMLFIGDSDGWVYQLDSGNSFNGQPVRAYARLPFNHVGSPAYNKRWKKVSVELDGGSGTTLGLTAEFSYGESGSVEMREQLFQVYGGGGFWDELLYDEFYWSSPVEGQAEAPVDGIGRNISVTIISEATYESPHTLHGLVLQYTLRGIAR